MKHRLVRVVFLAWTIFLCGGLGLCAVAQEAMVKIKPIRFEKKQIAAESYESVAVFDVNGDKKPDLVSGAFWYEGPDFVNRYFIKDVARHGEYWDDFATIPLDVNGDGKMDFITGGWFNKKLRWLQNPGNKQPWAEHLLDETGNVETARGWDVDNDGVIEIVPNNPKQPFKFYKLNRDANNKPTGEFTKVDVAESQGHGLGFGDVNGDGRGDFILSDGWLEAPKDLMKGKWMAHKAFNLGDAGVPILVVDVNKDGKNDLIVGQGHNFGLDWYEQRPGKAGKINWVKHPIDPYGSQYHTMEWIDLNGDGNPELVTGQRYRAHNGYDPGEKDFIGLYYYQWNGAAFVKQTIAYGPLGEGKGTGIYFSIADLRGIGQKDIIVAGKDGLYVFYNESQE